MRITNKFEKKNNRQAFTFNIGGFNVNATLVDGKEDSQFVSMPSYSYEKDGEKKYVSYVKAKDTDTMKSLQKLAIEAPVGSTGEKLPDVTDNMKVLRKREMKNGRQKFAVLVENFYINAELIDKDGNKFISLPSYSFTNADGVKEYKPLVVATKTTTNALIELVEAAPVYNPDAKDEAETEEPA